MSDNDTASSSETQEPSRDGDRRGWLYGSGIAMVVVVGLIAFTATRGDDGDHAGMSGMPGMDMGGADDMGAGRDVEGLPEMEMSGVSRMGDLVMPPGMVMTSGMSRAAMQDMAAVDPEEVDATAPADARGDQPLAARGWAG